MSNILFVVDCRALVRARPKIHAKNSGETALGGAARTSWM